MLLRKISLSQVEDYNDTITKVSVQGQEVIDPEGYQATDVLEQMELPLNVAFELYDEDTRLEVITVTVGTKG